MERWPRLWLTAPMHPQTDAAPAPDLTDLAAQTPDTRNRAVDFYRAAAMAVVAIGHWLGMVVVLDGGRLDGGNLLDFSPEYGWITFIGQVMPLFFFVGGYASASSLRAAERNGTPPADWVATRLRRMVTPAVALAATWAGVLALSAVAGGFGIASVGAYAAAIPLWFLANYTIDTALAPFTFRWFRTHPARLLGVLAGLFVVAEVAHFAGIPGVPWISWVIGWLGFQVAGFAWREGRLPSGRRLHVLAGSLWVGTLLAVNVGPWPAVMLHHGGLEHSPTHPPSTALLLFGFAYSLTAAALAPALDRWLARSPGAWRATVAANGIAMSVYLWHMTAAVVVAAIAYLGGWLPAAAPATAAWWWAKLPFIAANLAVLVPIVARVAPIEQRALLGGVHRWRGGLTSLMVTAAALSLSIKLWSSSGVVALAIGLTGTLAVWCLGLRSPATSLGPSPSDDDQGVGCIAR